MFCHTEFAVRVGIDWADRQHCWSLQVAGSIDIQRGSFLHTPESIQRWAMDLAERFPGQQIAIALEQSKGALVYALTRFQHLVIFPVHPSRSARYRSAMLPSGSKDDVKDSDLLLDLLIKHPERLRPLRPDTELTRKIQTLVEKRRQLVDQRTAECNRLTSELKLYFPQALELFDEVQAPIAAAFLERWPTLADVQREDPELLRGFFFQHHSRSLDCIQRRLKIIAEAKPLTTDLAVIEPAVIQVRIFIQLLAALHRGIRAMDQAIEQAAHSHPDFAIFASFPSAGPAMAPRLLAAFGSHRDRYQSATQLQAFTGIAPLKVASGSQCWIHFRWACPKFLRQTFHEYAALSIQQCRWANDFYKSQRAKQKGHHASVRSLAFKWIRILFRCWQSHCLYNEQIFLQARQPQSTSPATPAVPLAPGNPEDSRMKSVGELLRSIIATA